jgi:hypothetical protein
MPKCPKCGLNIEYLILETNANKTYLVSNANKLSEEQRALHLREIGDGVFYELKTDWNDGKSAKYICPVCINTIYTGGQERKVKLFIKGMLDEEEEDQKEGEVNETKMDNTI